MSVHVAPHSPDDVDPLAEIDRIEAEPEPTVADLARLDVLASDADPLVAMMARSTRNLARARARARRPEGITAMVPPSTATATQALPESGREIEEGKKGGGATPEELPEGSDQPITSLSTLVDQDVIDMAAGSFVAYYRVSTAKQGASGLGLDAQRAAVKTYLNGGDWRIAGEFVEVESGRSSDRPELAKALACARLHRAALVVANVSRLTRSSGFLNKLLDAGTDVRFADLPSIEGPTGRFMLQQMAAVAELEAGMIGDRTKKALAAAKARGTKLGGNRGVVLTEEQRAQGRAVQTVRSKARASDIRPIIADLQAEGVTSLAQLAAALTERGIPTSRGADRWSPMQVSRILRASADGP